jgi:hypothetical protein
LSAVTIACLTVGAGCGAADEASKGKPSAFRIAKAVITSLLSNSVEIRETPPTDPRPEQPGQPKQPEQSEALAATEPDAPQTCVVPYTGPVTIIPVPTAAALARSIADRPQVRVVYETEDAAIWEDGRVLTLDMEKLGAHLNAVGWAANPIRIVSASARPGGAAGSRSWNSGASPFKPRASARKRKRRRG